MPTEILNGVYDLTYLAGSGRRYRVYLFETDVPTLIDAGYEETTDTLIEEIETTGIEPERLLVTHGDGDHVGGFDAVVDRYGVETWVPAETNVPGSREPDHRFRDGERIGRFETIHVPGHAEDHYAFVDEAAGVLVPGDAIVGADLRGLPEGYLIAPPEVYSRDVAAAERNLERLLGYEFDAALVFHGTAVLDDAKQKLDRYVNFPRTPLS